MRRSALVWLLPGLLAVLLNVPTPGPSSGQPPAGETPERAPPHKEPAHKGCAKTFGKAWDSSLGRLVLCVCDGKVTGIYADRERHGPGTLKGRLQGDTLEASSRGVRRPHPVRRLSSAPADRTQADRTACVAGAVRTPRADSPGTRFRRPPAAARSRA